MNAFVFREPGWLFALTLLPLLVAYRWMLTARWRRALPFPAAAQLESAGGRNPFFPWIPIILLTTAAAAMVLALARPALRHQETSVSTEGVAILICMDISGSMQAEDFQPHNRIDVAKTVIADFVRKRPSDRIGLVSFAAVPFLRCPLTLDHRTLLTLVSELQTVGRSDLDGTAIGDALVAAGKRLLSAQEKSRVVILLTDGENNRGQFDPLQAAHILAGHKMRVDVVGIGSSGVVPYPVVGEDGRKAYQYVRIGFNEESLGAIAKETDGVYYNATDAHGLERVFEAIDKLERSRTESKGFVSFSELFLYPLGLALLCLVGHSLWVSGPGRSLP
jgi:Ca-activated chloride channel family protein